MISLRNVKEKIQGVDNINVERTTNKKYSGEQKMEEKNLN